MYIILIAITDYQCSRIVRLGFGDTTTFILAFNIARKARDFHQLPYRPGAMLDVQSQSVSILPYLNTLR